MPLIDDQGRLFGRVNLIDGIALILGLGLIPLVYGAFLMFRVPPPQIAVVSPTQVTEGMEAVIQLTGEDLRPFLDVRFGDQRSRGFFLRSPTHAEVRVPPLPAGIYDITLMDQGRVLLRKAGALTVVAAAAIPTGLKTELQAIGAFVGLTEAEARAIVAGLTLHLEQGAPPDAVVLTARPPERAVERVKVGENVFLPVPVPGRFRVRAIVRLRCAPREGECWIGDRPVTQDSPLSLSTPAGKMPMRFVVDEVRATDAPAAVVPPKTAIATVRVRFVAEPQILDVMKAGDMDVPGVGVIAETERALLTQLGADRQPVSTQLVTEGNLRRALHVQQAMVSVSGTLRVPVVKTLQGWTYKTRPIKSGVGFSFETITGGMMGWILSVEIGSER